jgi:hypothetical protein
VDAGLLSLPAPRSGVSFKALGRTPGGKAGAVALILFVVVPLFVVLYVLIFRMNHAKHFAPQSYYRKKRGGAPVAFGYEALGPRARKAPSEGE